MSGKDIAAVAALDVLSLLGIPTNSLAEVFRRYMEQRASDARSILIEEIAKGNVSNIQAATEDDGISIIVRYMSAARDGAARVNLRLLAKAIVGLSKRDKLFAEDFLQYVDILSRLTRDEIFVLGRTKKLVDEEKHSDKDEVKLHAVAKRRLMDELVPSHFPSEDHLLAVEARIAALGLMLSLNTVGGGTYKLSPIFEEICLLADFLDALEAEAKL